MFTRCPQCKTVFRISATQLRVAGGDVRCGNCAHVFNALGHLSDALPDGELKPAAGPDETAVAADASVAAPQESPGDGNLEFDAPEPTWSQFFIDATRKPSETAASTGGEGGDVPLDGELETITADPDEWRAFLDEMDDSPATRWEDDDMAPDALGREQQVYVVDEADAGAGFGTQRDAEVPAVPVAPLEMDATAADRSELEQSGEGASGDTLADDYLVEEKEFDDDLAHPLAGNEHPVVASGFDATGDDLDNGLPGQASIEGPESEWQEQTHAGGRRSGLWLAASLAMLALLVAQVVHVNRDSLAADEGFGPRLRELYAGLGLPLYPEWPLEAYRVRRAEAMAGGSTPESLDITAAVETTGGGTLGLPLVRVALRDQWANVVASRVFAPEQYLPEPLPEIVPAGTRIPVRLSVVDPGSEARGFVVDLCLPRRSGLDCQLNRDPFAR